MHSVKQLRKKERASVKERNNNANNKIIIRFFMKSTPDLCYEDQWAEESGIYSETKRNEKYAVWQIFQVPQY
jgi:hypothetical protein